MFSNFFGAPITREGLAKDICIMDLNVPLEISQKHKVLELNHSEPDICTAKEKKRMLAFDLSAIDSVTISA